MTRTGVTLSFWICSSRVELNVRFDSWGNLALIMTGTRDEGQVIQNL